VSQSYATALATSREITYPQGFYTIRKGFGWLTPPSVGRVLIVLVYWVVIILMLTSNAIVHDAYYFERIGFRAAWISLMQIPFIIILAAKVNILGFLIGSSYERLNWLHRWVSRTLWVTVTAHGAFFLAEWVRADFVSLELSMMPIVKYGMGAWGVLTWMNLSGLAPLRHIAYEFFVLQHLASAALILWLLHMHVPSYAQFYVWIGIGFVVFDRVARFAWVFVRNIKVRRGLRATDRIGFETEIESIAGNVTSLTIKDVAFKWTPGQHIYVCIPRLGLIESHPFTITNIPSKTQQLNDVHLAIVAHSGFSRRLHRLASRPNSGRPAKVRTFIQGPFGSHPTWNTFETVVLISASTGTSFTLPILESIIENPCCVRRVDLLLLVKSNAQCTCYLNQLKKAASQGSRSELELHILVVATGEPEEDKDDGQDGLDATDCSCGPDTETCCCAGSSNEDDGNAESSIDGDSIDAFQTDKKGAQAQIRKATPRKEIQYLNGRPDISDVIRGPIEEARGESCVVVCGGRSLASHVRNSVASLSDERAVHKGTGAQGIFLHVEEFGF
jgi:NAD(P)H-flavin reductase